MGDSEETEAPMGAELPKPKHKKSKKRRPVRKVRVEPQATDLKVPLMARPDVVLIVTAALFGVVAMGSAFAAVLWLAPPGVDAEGVGRAAFNRTAVSVAIALGAGFAHRRGSKGLARALFTGAAVIAVSLALEVVLGRYSR